MHKLPANNDGKAPTQQESNPPAPVTAEHPIFNTGKENNTITNGSEDKGRHKNNINWPSWITAICTIFIVIITGLYTYYASEQVRQIGAQLRLDQRAWMGITTITGNLEIGKPIVGTVSFRNTGKTPAKKVTITMVLETIKPDDSPDFGKEKNVEINSREVVAPQQEVYLTGFHIIDSQNQFVNDNVIRDVLNGKKLFYIHGILEYEDIFGYPHWITYCSFFDTKVKGYKVYKEHNDTDDN